MLRWISQLMREWEWNNTNNWRLCHHRTVLLESLRWNMKRGGEISFPVETSDPLKSLSIKIALN